jgi:predicted ArsR family transcriptional regulator
MMLPAIEREERLNEILAVVQAAGEICVHDLAAQLKISKSTAKQRIRVLVDLGAITYSETRIEDVGHRPGPRPRALRVVAPSVQLPDAVQPLAPGPRG